MFQLLTGRHVISKLHLHKIIF